MAKIIARLRETRTDRTDYRKYQPIFEFEKVFLELEVKEVKPKIVEWNGQEVEGIVLTLKGLEALLELTAAAVDRVQEKHLNSL